MDKADVIEIMKHLMEIKTLTAKIGAKQEAVHETVVKLDTKVNMQNGRIGKLESWRSYILGAFAVVSIIGGILWGLIK